MIPFDINPRLEGDSYPVADLPLCAVRLLKDATYPWLMLIPRKSDLIEIIDLDADDRHRLMDEIALASRVLIDVTNCEKLNVGALGNQVSQLHVHVIGRFREDAAWPGPVWGAVPPTAYQPGAADDLITSLRTALAG